MPHKHGLLVKALNLPHYCTIWLQQFEKCFVNRAQLGHGTFHDPPKQH